LNFKNLKAVFEQFNCAEFTQLIDRRRSEWINRTLLNLIQNEPEPCFLLPDILDYVKKVEEEGLLQHYTFTSFELWLNQFSNLDFEENYRIRAKIAGKWIPRCDYQIFFPIGSGKVYEGTHFVTAHHSPDLDTTVASFWGWLDAFAARVGNGLHIWNLPGEPTSSKIEIDLLFRKPFGSAILTHLPKMRTALTLTGNDLMTQKRLQKKVAQESFSAIDHDRDHNAVVVVDPSGFYLGDWRAIDADEVRQTISLLLGYLHWFENSFYVRLASLFAQKAISQKELSTSLHQLFDLKLEECEPAHQLTIKQRNQLQKFLTLVLQIKEGLKISFNKLPGLPKLDALLSNMAHLFDQKGHLIEDRPRIFDYLEQIFKDLHLAIIQVRSNLEQLQVALSIKEKVFAHHLTFVTVRTDVEEIRAKMGSYPYLTVVYPDQGKLYPVGIIPSSDLRKTTLGTVSLRDFCNRNEMEIPSYLEVISVIDHHKSSLKTYAPPMALIGDVQSSNTIVADCAMQINDSYSLGGMTPEVIEKQLKDPENSISLTQRLLKRKLAVQRSISHYIHPERESLEYLHFLYAILDDTDLLTKVTPRDVEVATSLLNRIKSLSLKKEIEVVSIENLPCKEAAQRLLQNEEMYALYRKNYEYREIELNHTIKLAAQKKPSDFFVDTKEQNGCCRVGQTKLFSKNISLFEKHANEIRSNWVAQAIEEQKKHPELNLHMHMLSTIASAEEVFTGSVHKPKDHRDELWIWIEPSELGVEHLKNFLNSFQAALGKDQAPLDVEFLGENAADLSQIFKESFFEIPHKLPKKGDPSLPIAILRYRAGSLNSRKAMISPYLPSASG